MKVLGQTNHQLIRLRPEEHGPLVHTAGIVSISTIVEHIQFSEVEIGCVSCGLFWWARERERERERERGRGGGSYCENMSSQLHCCGSIYHLHQTHGQATGTHTFHSKHCFNVALD